MGNNAGPRPGIDEDQGDFHEAFLDISTGLDDQRSITTRLGEQEIVYGTGRLVDNNEGVNVKSSFYGARIIAKTETLRLELFGVKPTEQNTGTFEDRPSSQQTFGELTERCHSIFSIAAAKPTSINWASTRHALPIGRVVGVRSVTVSARDCSIIKRALRLNRASTITGSWSISPAHSRKTISTPGVSRPKRVLPFRFILRSGSRCEQR